VEGKNYFSMTKCALRCASEVPMPQFDVIHRGLGLEASRHTLTLAAGTAVRS
jgi:hypothetical protein